MKYYLWKIDEKTNVPSKVLDTEDKEAFITSLNAFLEQGVQFAARVENKNEKPKS